MLDDVLKMLKMRAGLIGHKEASRDGTEKNDNRAPIASKASMEEIGFNLEHVGMEERE